METRLLLERWPSISASIRASTPLADLPKRHWSLYVAAVWQGVYNGEPWANRVCCVLLHGTRTKLGPLPKTGLFITAQQRMAGNFQKIVAVRTFQYGNFATIMNGKPCQIVAVDRRSSEDNALIAVL